MVLREKYFPYEVNTRPRENWVKTHIGKSYIKHNYQSPPNAARKLPSDEQVNKMVENHDSFVSMYIRNPTYTPAPLPSTLFLPSASLRPPYSRVTPQRPGVWILHMYDYSAFAGTEGRIIVHLAVLHLEKLCAKVSNNRTPLLSLFITLSLQAVKTRSRVWNGVIFEAEALQRVMRIDYHLEAQRPARRMIFRHVRSLGFCWHRKVHDVNPHRYNAWQISKMDCRGTVSSRKFSRIAHYENYERSQIPLLPFFVEPR